ncbi:MAG: hypothetical protein AAGI44_10990, partial [Pseudomonadota bacterium]
LDISLRPITLDYAKQAPSARHIELMLWQAIGLEIRVRKRFSFLSHFTSADRYPSSIEWPGFESTNLGRFLYSNRALFTLLKPN